MLYQHLPHKSQSGNSMSLLVRSRSLGVQFCPFASEFCNARMQRQVLSCGHVYGSLIMDGYVSMYTLSRSVMIYHHSIFVSI